jgi:succinate dehydrogenase/fumarate reductase-like Fe-S protein
MKSKILAKINFKNYPCNISKERKKYFGRLKSVIKTLNDFKVAKDLIVNDLNYIHKNNLENKWLYNKIIEGTQKKLLRLEECLIDQAIEEQ